MFNVSRLTSFVPRVGNAPTLILAFNPLLPCSVLGSFSRRVALVRHRLDAAQGGKTLMKNS